MNCWPNSHAAGNSCAISDSDNGNAVDEEPLERYIEQLINVQNGLCALTGLALQYDGEGVDQELLCSWIVSTVMGTMSLGIYRWCVVLLIAGKKQTINSSVD